MRLGNARRGGVLNGAAAALASIGFGAAQLATGAAFAQDQAVAPGISLELNRVEDQGTACRVYFVLDNATADAFESFKLDLVAFGRDGVILRNVATEMGPLRPSKKIVKRFDLADLPCAGLGAILVNDVLDCRSGEAARTDCVDLLTVTSRAEVELAK